MTELPNEGVPFPLNIDMPSVPGVVKGDAICLKRIDSKTGLEIEQKIPLTGMLAASCAIAIDSPEYKASIDKGGHAYVVTQAMKEQQKQNPDRGMFPARTGRIDRIDRMSDGSYWLYTSKSVYRLSIGIESHVITINSDAVNISNLLNGDTELMSTGDTVVE